MGSGTNVRCEACGYSADDLLGVGGQIGMLGQPVWTVACSKARGLIDVWAPDDPVSRERYWYRVEWGDVDVPCPECGEVHEVWDPDEGSAPAVVPTAVELSSSG